MSGELFDAIMRGDVARMEKALAAGADPDALETGEQGWRPLHAAIEAIDVEGAPLAVLQVLLDRGAQVNVWDRSEEATPLLMAVFRLQPDSVRLLLAHGADPDVVGDEGETPILWAIAEENDAIVDLLLDHGLSDSINQPGSMEGTTPLGAAASRGRLDLVERLLADGADPNVLDYDHCTAEKRAQFSLSTATGELADRLQRVIQRLRSARRGAQ